MSDSSPAASRPAVSAVADLVAICVFVAIGRSSHDEGASVTGFLSTLWPFLVGAAIGWMIAAAVAGGRGFAAAALWPTGVIVWVATVAAGMVLRVFAGQGTAVSFIIVASVATGVLLLGWRALVRLASRRRLSA